MSIAKENVEGKDLKEGFILTKNDPTTDDDNNIFEKLWGGECDKDEDCADPLSYCLREVTGTKKTM